MEIGQWGPGFLSIHQFGLVDEGGNNDNNPPFIGPGSIFGNISGDLGISDGYNNGGVDTMDVIISDSYVYNAGYDGSTDFGQRMFDAFTGTGTLETFLGGFIEGMFEWVNDPNWVIDPDNLPDGSF